MKGNEYMGITSHGKGQRFWTFRTIGRLPCLEPPAGMAVRRKWYWHTDVMAWACRLALVGMRARGVPSDRFISEGIREKVAHTGAGADSLPNRPNCIIFASHRLCRQKKAGSWHLAYTLVYKGKDQLKKIA